MLKTMELWEMALLMIPPDDFLRKVFFFEGKGKVNGFEIPLDNGGELLERFIKATENFTKPLNSLSTYDLLLASP
ncbi:hypothetical protein Scep_019168 [Stephania cephalantha]|uniref:Uncharacterized protein n=1 Tax=Stephania cephalantha TaxID=152367 RepID=A0AAP0IA84_9MAGN